MSTIAEQKRSERLYVRLTSGEAAYVEDLAGARGLTVSDLVREAVLKRSGFRWRVSRNALPDDAASLIRQLGTIAADLRRLTAIAESREPLASHDLGECLARVHAAIAAFGP